MRILHLTRDLHPRSTGGLSAAVAGLRDALAQAGQPSDALSFDAWRPRGGGRAVDAPGPPEVDGGGQVLRLTQPSQLGAARAWAAARRPQIVHVHDALLWEVGARIREDVGARAVFTAHVLQREQSRLRGIAGETLSSAAEARALEEADVLLAPSPAAADVMTAWLPSSRRGQLRVTPLGVADSPAARRAAEGRREDDPPGPAIYAGRFADVHGFTEVLEALPILLRGAPGARVVLAGGLPESPRGDRRWRRRVAQALPADLVERVELPGWLDPSALSALYTRGSLLMAPSRFETFGLSPLEAQLHGIPVVATEALARTGVVEAGAGSLLIPPGDGAAVAKAALTLLGDRSLACRLGAAGAARVRARFTWPAVIGAHLLAYQASQG